MNDICEFGSQLLFHLRFDPKTCLHSLSRQSSQPLLTFLSSDYSSMTTFWDRISLLIYPNSNVNYLDFSSMNRIFVSFWHVSADRRQEYSTLGLFAFMIYYSILECSKVLSTSSPMIHKCQAHTLWFLSFKFLDFYFLDV